jgi:hypothetical protein
LFCVGNQPEFNLCREVSATLLRKINSGYGIMSYRSKKMQVTRVTLSLPIDLWEDVKASIPARQRSKVIAGAIEAELRHRKRQAQLANLRQFQKAMREKYGELPSSAADIEEMRQERCHNGR